MNTTKIETPFGSVKLPGNTDKELFERLGLNKIECKKYYEEYYLGEVVKKGDTGYKIKIWVSVAPAKFWKFEVFTNENKTTTILTTGSGNLCVYWDTM